MALFKVSYGAKQNLVNQAIKDGFCWYTPEDGKFYIDAKINLNLLEGQTFVKDRFLGSDGTPGYSVYWEYTENFIAINPNTGYVGIGLRTGSTDLTWNLACLILYDKNKTMIGSYQILDGEDLSFTTPANAAFLRTSIRSNNKESATLFEVGRNALSAIPVSYGTCEAGSNSVIIPGITLQNGVPPVGAMICVNFADANPGISKSLVVNNGYINSNPITITTAAGAAGIWQANALVALVYNGTNWIIQSNNILENRFSTQNPEPSHAYSVLFGEQQVGLSTNTSHELQVLQKTDSFKYYPASGKTATTSLALGDEHVLLEYNSSSQTLNFIFN